MFLEQNRRTALEIGEKEVKMYECTGKIHSIYSFADKKSKLLSNREIYVIEQQKEHLKLIAIPLFVNKCLTRSQYLAINQEYKLMSRNGARSAYDEQSKIKFKGCRPEIHNNSTFPVESIDYRSKTIIYHEVPFGILTDEGVLREILAYCFCLSYNIPVAHEPVCIYEYFYGDKSIGFCLLLKSLAGDKRIEQLIEYPVLSLKKLIEIKTQKLKTNFLIGSELRIPGMNVHYYSRMKADLLIKLHFNCGFRGILNSNIGNDIVDGANSLYLCDYDTFYVIELPVSINQMFLNDFVLSCLIEVLKSSISILDFIVFEENVSLREKNRLLFEKYKEKSTLWKYYWTVFLKMANQINWSNEMIEIALENCLETKAFHKTISLVLPNNSEINNIVENRTVYYSHN